MRARIGVVVLALAVGGCSWSTFDDLKKETPVLAIGAPSDYPAGDDFGPILLPLAPPADKSAAGRFIATATNKTSVGVMYFDDGGHVRGTGVTGTAFEQLANGPVNEIAAIPGGTQVLLGAPAPLVGDVLVMNVDPPFQTTTFQELAESQFGVGVGAGDITGTAAPEYVVLSSTTLHVYLDGVPSAEHTRMDSGAADPCPIAFTTALPPRYRANRAVIIAPLLGTATSQIAVGAPNATASSPGHVSIFDVDASGNITCSAALTASEALFGRAMTLVDVDGDGTPDHLLVGAPPTRAYLFTLPLSNNQAPAMMVSESMAGSDFGAALAAFDIDGKAGDEMFVGDPAATVDGTDTAGRVSIYTGAAMSKTLAMTIPNPLAMHEPKAGDGYGSGIAGMTFCPGAGVDAGSGSAAPCTKLPLVGSLSKVYAYFTLRKPDPRVK